MRVVAHAIAFLMLLSMGIGVAQAQDSTSYAYTIGRTNSALNTGGAYCSVEHHWENQPARWLLKLKFPAAQDRIAYEKGQSAGMIWALDLTGKSGDQQACIELLELFGPLGTEVPGAWQVDWWSIPINHPMKKIVAFMTEIKNTAMLTIAVCIGLSIVVANFLGNPILGVPIAAALSALIAWFSYHRWVEAFDMTFDYMRATPPFIILVTMLTGACVSGVKYYMKSRNQNRLT